LERSECGPETVDELRAAFHEVARIDNTRVRITPDPDVAAENHILRTLDPLEFSPPAVQRAFTLGRMVAKRVLKRYRFEFLD
jgi:ribose 1,5-bisphosphokinase PhnN